MERLRNAAVCFSTALVASCISRDVAELEPHPTGEVLKDIPLSADIDILFVIDNSSSTCDKQTVFAQNFPRFIQALDAFPTGRPNVHIGVVTSSVDIGVAGFAGCHPVMDGDGLLLNTPRIAGCSPPRDRYISDIKNPDGTRTTNYTGPLASTFSCIAQIGCDGCGFEHQMEGMKRALDGSRPENAGFIRPSAFLAVVILTDEDDCSDRDKSLYQLPASIVGGMNDFRCQPMFAYDCDTPIVATGPGAYTNCKVRRDSYLQDPRFYSNFLIGLKGDPSRVVLALIAGDPTKDIATGPVGVQTLALLPSCMATINGNQAIGRPAIRLTDFMQPFGGHGIFRTVCESDYSQALADIGKLLFNAVTPCLEGKVDTTDLDPSQPGLQIDCQVTEVQNEGTAAQTEQVMVRCPMSNATTAAPSGPRPCWWVTPNPTVCQTPTGLELHVERASAPPPFTNVRIRCVATP